MQRKDFIKYITAIPILSKSMTLTQLANHLPNTTTMPVLFLGHGSPMNAIEENEFVQGFRNCVVNIPKPKAILCISAHWETNGTLVTAMENPKTIHDFGGFPKALFDVEYPAPGSKWLAEETKKTVTSKNVKLDETWGLDHGAWSVIKHLYPKADVPVIQLSLDYNLTPQQHFELASQLKSLRNKGVLIVGSGNIVHNLGLVAWDKLQEKEYGYDWAIEVNTKIKSFIQAEDFKSLANYKNFGKAFQLAIPTPEHYLPLLYTLALKDKKETTQFFNDKAIGGSLTMTSLKIT